MGTIMGVPKRLTDIQKRFSELHVYHEGRKTPYECAVEAGYAEDSARVRASELRNPQRYPLVVQYIGELTGKLEDLTEQELEARMKQIIKEYSPILDAKPIEEIKKEVKAIGIKQNTSQKEELRPLKQITPDQD